MQDYWPEFAPLPADRSKNMFPDAVEPRVRPHSSKRRVSANVCQERRRLGYPTPIYRLGKLSKRSVAAALSSIDASQQSYLQQTCSIGPRLRFVLGKPEQSRSSAWILVT